MQIHLEKKFSSHVFLRITEAIEVTQEINSTGIIPLEALHAYLLKRPHSMNLYKKIFVYIGCSATLVSN